MHCVLDIVRKFIMSKRGMRTPMGATVIYKMRDWNVVRPSSGLSHDSTNIDAIWNLTFTTLALSLARNGSVYDLPFVAQLILNNFSASR